MTKGPAMTRQEAIRALEVGMRWQILKLIRALIFRNRRNGYRQYNTE